MITGFNTDVRHGDVVFHVQTEDKGEGNPCVESLIYVGGQILARKRAGYQSLLETEGALAEVAKLMEQQHRSMISEIRAGKLDDKLAQLKGGGAPAATPPASTKVEPPPAPTKVEPPPTSTKVEPPPASTRVEPPAAPETPAAAEPAERVDRRTVAATPLKKLLGSAGPPTPPPKSTAERPAVPKPGPPPAKPPPAAATTAKSDESSTPAADDRSLDQVILDYLEMESELEKLVLSMDRRSGELVAGREVTVTFRARSSLGAEPIAEAKIAVRLISTSGEPKLLGEGRTDDRGQLELTLDVPVVKAGSGALIISGESSIGKAEIRHLI